MTLWWLLPGWKDANCPHCGRNIWGTGGDPDWGECYECKAARHRHEQEPEPEPVPKCDMCGQYDAVAGVGEYGVCSWECQEEARRRMAKEEKPEDAGKEGKRADGEGLGTIRVLIFLGQERLVAQCLEYDIAVQAKNFSGLMRRLLLTIDTQINLDVSRGIRPLSQFEKAPTRYEREWNDAMKFQPEKADWRRMAPPPRNKPVARLPELAMALL